jgi:2-methylcitrate dehydratase PrpD
MPGTAEALAWWASDLTPTDIDVAFARRALIDTVAVTLAAGDEALRIIVAALPDSARWSAMGHLLDFDDLHIESTAHISVVIVPAVLAAGGDAGAYLAGAGVMARLGQALGWRHYAAGWHATCTAGAPAAAVASGIALGLTTEQLASAIALAVPASGGVQRAFGTHAKSLQVGFATQAGVRAAQLAARGATADPAALDDWLALVGGAPDRLDLSGPAVPGGLAVKMFPCCYALQRPIAAIRELRGRHHVDPAQVARLTVRTPADTIAPLIHDQPRTGLEAKFSLPYAMATALLDDHPDFTSFSDEAVRRPAAQQLMNQVEVVTTPGGGGLLAGEVTVEIELASGEMLSTSLAQPPGSPASPPTEAELVDKLAHCGVGAPELMTGLDWTSAGRLLREVLPRNRSAEAEVG